jgi:hypothetical protein
MVGGGVGGTGKKSGGRQIKAAALDPAASETNINATIALRTRTNKALISTLMWYRILAQDLWKWTS